MFLGKDSAKEADETDDEDDSTFNDEASQKIKKGSSIRKKRKLPCSSFGNQGNLKKAKRKSSQQTSEPALEEDSCKNRTVLAERPVTHFADKKDKSDNDVLATNASGDKASLSSSDYTEADSDRKGELATGPRGLCFFMFNTC
ncbi:uncharacterized protein LOC110060229 [Orbicella faveolata]|uniref:uncharacterized protein LOC110060229 n=1 Tax=Orbicella faveolata TaxID=48498 RepID=UPI0009E18E18|nr:uncharacterized protein LOC110060229 [Orbicella faveolata]